MWVRHIFTQRLQQGEFHNKKCVCCLFSYLASHFLPSIFSCSCIFGAFAGDLPQARETTNSLDKFVVCNRTHSYWNLIGWTRCLERWNRNRFYPRISERKHKQITQITKTDLQLLSVVPNNKLMIKKSDVIFKKLETQCLGEAQCLYILITVKTDLTNIWLYWLYVKFWFQF